MPSENESAQILRLSATVIHQPCFCDQDSSAAYSPIARESGLRITRYLRQCADYAHGVFTQSRPAGGGSPSDVVTALTDILLSHEFNYQSRGRVAHLLPSLQETLASQVSRNAPIQLFMSYNGGYHATTAADFSTPLGFDAAATELLFLFMIARLKARLSAVYPPGMVYHIVLNNGVAHYVNDIPLARTEDYARQMESMIAQLGGQQDVRVLVQSHLGDFAARMRAMAIDPAEAIDADTHHNIERFLGRACTEAEARLRLGRYAPAEAAWWQELRDIIVAAGGIRLLQVASPSFLSFRPFPGAATRAQTGQVGFRINGEKLVPTLVTTKTRRTAEVLAVPVDWPSVLRRAPYEAPARIQA